METNPYDRIIWSADVPNIPTLLSQLELMPQLRNIKIDASFVEDNDWTIFPLLHRRGLKVFDDAKLIEIPSKLEKRAEIHCRRATPWMLNCMAHSVSNGHLGLADGEIDGLKRFATVCNDRGVASCAVTVLTSKDDPVAVEEFNGRRTLDQVLWYAELLVEAGFTDMVCSPQEAKRIRRDPHFDALKLNTPGIRSADAPQDDQARTMTPAEAIQAGANRLVIGRPITNGPGTPAENLAAIAAEIASAL